LRGLSLLYLPVALAGGATSLGWFAVFYGLDWIATVPPTVRLTSEAFGRENTGVIYGWIGASHQLGASTAAFGAGAIRTLAGDYRPAFWIAGTLGRPGGHVVSRHRPAAVSDETFAGQPGDGVGGLKIVLRSAFLFDVLRSPFSARPSAPAGHAEPRTCESEARHQRQFARGVGQRPSKNVSSRRGWGPAASALRCHLCTIPLMRLTSRRLTSR
jgi:hypothetical protein